MKTQILSLLLLLHIIAASDSDGESEELKEARKHLDFLNEGYQYYGHKVSEALWNFVTNITEETSRIKKEIVEEYLKKEKEWWQKTVQFNWQNFSDPDVKRQFDRYAKLGLAVLPNEKYKTYMNITDEMLKIYSTAMICDYKNASKCDLSLDPDITSILETSSDIDEKKHVWVEWRKASGAKIRNLYSQYVDLTNEAALLNNYTSADEQWVESYEDPNFKQEVESLWLQLQPLYIQIHAYIRFNLRKKYGNKIPERGPIPSHYLGSNWGQNWRSIGKDFLPYPDKSGADVTEELKRQNYTVFDIYKAAEDFFKSINLTEMPEAFWQNSLFEKPSDRQVSCHPAALDMVDGKDFRITFCTDVNFDDFVTVHHEMGHIEYFIQYKDLPFIYRTSANPGFHEAIGDLISLSVVSHKHLKRIGLTKDEGNDPESVLNNLYMNGLTKIVALPLNYLIDLWRWNVFNGNITSDNYNCAWWELREKYQGIAPANHRTEHDFDPGAAFHIAAGLHYIDYFIAYVVQYQFHKALCEIAGEYDPNDSSKPLYECDIYKHPEAGNALKKMLQIGASKPWPDAMELLTGQREMDASGLLEYFKPLHEWLVKKNEENGAYVGWETSTSDCSSDA